MAIATFGAGCFWGVEEAFDELDGVQETCVGYSGGHTENPTYELVCSGQTGHAEVVRVEYDPEQVSYEELLELFWRTHDPTTLNRQGPDVGTQYRSAIFHHTAEQEAAARTSREEVQASGSARGEIVTEITPAPVFYLAEDYHQKFFAKRRQAFAR